MGHASDKIIARHSRDISLPRLRAHTAVLLVATLLLTPLGGAALPTLSSVPHALPSQPPTVAVGHRDPLQYAPVAAAPGTSPLVDTTAADFAAGSYRRGFVTDVAGGEFHQGAWTDLGIVSRNEVGIESLALDAGNDTLYGGTNGTGLLFKVDTVDSTITMLNGGNRVLGSASVITDLVVGTDDNLWGATDDGHVFRMDLVTEQVTVINGGAAVTAGRIYALLFHSDGRLWAVADTPEVLTIDPSTDALTSRAALLITNVDRFTSIVEGLDADIWIGLSRDNGACGTSSGSCSAVTRVDETTNLSTATISVNGGDETIRSLVASRDGRIYTAGEDDGGGLGNCNFQFISTATNTVTGGAGSAIATMVGGGVVSCVSYVEDKEGLLWGGGLRGAWLWQWNKVDTVTAGCCPAPSPKALDFGARLGAVALPSLAVGDDASLWLGTQQAPGSGGHLIRFQPVITHQSVAAQGGWVTASTELDDGRTIWALEDPTAPLNGHLLLRVNSQTFEYQYVNGGVPPIAGQFITSLATDPNGLVWGATAQPGGTDNGRLFRYDPVADSVTVINAGTAIIAATDIAAIDIADNGTLWGVTTCETGDCSQLFRVDTANDAITLVSPGVNVAPARDGQSIFIDATGDVWVGTTDRPAGPNGELVRVEGDNDTFTNLGVPQPNVEVIYDFAQGTDGMVYAGIGTDNGANGAVLMIDPADNSSTVLPMDDTTVSDVRAIEQDGYGGLWLGQADDPAGTGDGHIGWLAEGGGRDVDNRPLLAGDREADAYLIDRNGTLWGHSHYFNGFDFTKLFRADPNTQFTSRILDAGDLVEWDTLEYDLNATGGLALLRVRTGTTPALLNASAWSPWNGTNGTTLTLPTGRYIQYQAVLLMENLSMNVWDANPTLEEVRISFTPLPLLTLGLATADLNVTRGGTFDLLLSSDIAQNGAGETIVELPLPPQLSLVTSTEEGVRSGTVWTFPTLGLGPHSFTATLQVNQSTMVGTLLDLQSNGNTSSPLGTVLPSVVSPVLSLTVVDIPSPALMLSAPTTSFAALPGEVVTIALQLDNSGLGTATMVTLLAEGIAAPWELTGSSAEAQRNGSTWTLADLLPAEDLPLSFDVTIAANATPTTDDSIDLTLAGANIYGEPIAESTLSVDLSVLQPPVPGLTLELTPPSAQAAPGGAVTLQAVLTNTGDGPAALSTLNLTLGGPLQLQGSSDEANRTGTLFALGEIAADDSRSVQLTVAVDGAATDGEAATASVAATFVDPFDGSLHSVAPAMVTLDIVVPPTARLDLQLDPDGIVTVQPGATTTARVFYNNSGDAAAPWARIVATMQADLVTLTGSSAPTEAPGATAWNDSDVPPGAASFTMTLTVAPTVPDGTKLAVLASLQYLTSVGGSIMTDNASVTLLVRGTPIDVVAPTVLSTTPANGTRDLAPLTRITIVFSKPMAQVATVAAVSLAPFIAANGSWDGATVTLTLAQPTAAGTNYTVTIATSAVDLGGNALAQPYLFSFGIAAKVVDQPPKDDHPGTDWLTSGLNPWWLLLAALIVGGIVVAVLLSRRRKGSEPTGAEPQGRTSGAPSSPEAPPGEGTPAAATAAPSPAETAAGEPEPATPSPPNDPWTEPTTTQDPPPMQVQTSEPEQPPKLDDLLSKLEE